MNIESSSHFYQKCASPFMLWRRVLYFLQSTKPRRDNDSLNRFYEKRVLPVKLPRHKTNERIELSSKVLQTILYPFELLVIQCVRVVSSHPYSLFKRVLIRLSYRHIRRERQDLNLRSFYALLFSRQPQ